MEVVSFRIPKELKEKMKKFKHINWSKAIREKIEEIIEKEENRNLAIALLLNEKAVITPDEGWSSTDEIRKWRESIRWKS
ncbi:MAG: hypothetical protein J7L07_09255 [Candidatus Odinarchaeota archaeon]|nr:hypothetical protein [Candidatus Odinarchaeota archaeon]